MKADSQSLAALDFQSSKTDGRRSAFMEHMASKGVTVSAVHQRNDVHSCVARFSCLLPKVRATPTPTPYPYPIP